jgi:curli biogenesis system outer membrane secretion channel CsgG
MVKRSVILGVCMGLSIATLAPLVQAGDKPRIAVLEFRNKADSQWWWHGGSKAVQDVFVTELVKSGKFQVIEREQLSAIMQEKGLTLSGDVDPSTAVRVGKLLGVNYLLTGAVTEYGVTDKSAHGSGIGRLPGFSAGKRSFVAALNARLIDTSTGEIVWADEARNQTSSFGGGQNGQQIFDEVMKPVIPQLTASLKPADL